MLKVKKRQKYTSANKKFWQESANRMLSKYNDGKLFKIQTVQNKTMKNCSQNSNCSKYNDRKVFKIPTVQNITMEKSLEFKI